MKKESNFNRTRLLGIGLLAIGFLIGLSAEYSFDKREQVISERVVPKDLALITFSNISWENKPKITCYVPNGEEPKVFRNGTIYFDYKGLKEIQRTDTAILYAPKSFLIVPDPYPGDIIWIENETQRYFNTYGLCRVNPLTLTYIKTVVYGNTTVFQEKEWCPLNIRIDNFEPYEIEKAIYRCFLKDGI